MSPHLRRLSELLEFAEKVLRQRRRTPKVGKHALRNQSRCHQHARSLSKASADQSPGVRTSRCKLRTETSLGTAGDKRTQLFRASRSRGSAYPASAETQYKVASNKHVAKLSTKPYLRTCFCVDERPNSYNFSFRKCFFSPIGH